MESPSTPSEPFAADSGPDPNAESTALPYTPVPVPPPARANSSRNVRLALEAAGGAVLFIAGVGIGLAIDGDSGGAAAADGDLEAAKETCAVGSSDVRIGDGGDTMTIDRMGAEESPGATFTQFECILEELEVPDSVVDRINNTRALDGYQDASFADFAVSWTYHPDDGLNMTITRAE
ncbi:MAG TPA: hypothetical protein VHG10_08495 [Glycomyces sp.]|nr:hypothetical protein [Glycomyces sp.]